MEWDLPTISFKKWNDLLNEVIESEHKGILIYKDSKVKVFYGSLLPTDYKILRLTTICLVSNKILMKYLGETSDSDETIINTTQNLRRKIISPLLTFKKNVETRISLIETNKDKLDTTDKKTKDHIQEYIEKHNPSLKEVNDDLKTAQPLLISCDDKELQIKLHNAIRAGKIKELKEIILMSIHPNGEKLNSSIYTAVETICKKPEENPDPYFKIITFLASVGASINAASIFKGNTSLHHAVRMKNATVVEFLIQNGAKLIKDAEGNTPFDLAKLHSDPKIHHILKKFYKLPSINSYLPPMDQFSLDESRLDDSVLAKSVEAGNTEKVKSLLPNFFATDPDYLAKIFVKENSKGLSPLAIAVRYNYPEILKLLVTYGANPNAPTSRNIPMFHETYSNEYMKSHSKIMFLELLRAGADIFIEDKKSNLWNSIIVNKNYDLLILLLKEWSDRNKKAQLEHEVKEELDSKELSRKKIVSTDHQIVSTGLFNVIYECINAHPSYFAFIEMFFIFGFNIHSKDKNGDTLVTYLAQKDIFKNRSYIDYFFKKGANFNLVNTKKDCPLLLAVRNRNPEILDNLIRIPGIDLRVQDRNQNSLLHIAVETGNLNHLNKLLIAGVNPNLQNNSGMTPLMLAISKNNLPAIKILLKTKNNFELEDHEGNSTLMHAALMKNDQERSEILDLIEKLV